MWRGTGCRWFPSTCMQTSARSTRRPARAAWPTCSSTWPSRERRKIGTTDYVAEKAALDRVDDVIASLYEERRKREQADPEQLQELEEALKQAQEEADQYVVNNHLSEIVEQAGAVGLNASTSSDATRYFYSLPSNKLELWFALESDRFLNPVLREFYKERDVVIEERRMRVESQPTGNLLEDFLSVATKPIPMAWRSSDGTSDLENLTRPAARDFFNRFYTPPNLTAFIVGDVEPQEVIRLAELYFGRLPPGPTPEALWTVEPPQEGERRTTVYARSQPLVVIGYHKPSTGHPVGRTYLTPLPQPGRRQENCHGGSGLSRLSGEQVSQSVSVLRVPDSRPY